MHTLKLTLKPENLSLELTYENPYEPLEVLRRVLTALPGGRTTAIGGSVELVADLSQRILSRTKGAEVQPAYIMQTAPYTGRKIDEINIHELRSFRRVDSKAIPEAERAIIDAYLHTRRND